MSMRFILLASLLAAAPAALAQESHSPSVQAPPRMGPPAAFSLRQPIRASGPALRLGDVFQIDGPAADREIAPAPPQGQSGVYSTAFLAAAAQAAGYGWSPPPGVKQVVVEGPGSGMTYDVAPDQRGKTEAVIRKGDLVTISYTLGALRLSTRAKAIQSAAAGEPVRVMNLDSQRVIDAIATGPGQATASSP